MESRGSSKVQFWKKLDDYGKFQAKHPESPDPFDGDPLDFDE